MPEQKNLPVFWTEKALQNAVSIKEYLEENFSDKEVEGFLKLLKTFEDAVSVFPGIYPLSARRKKVRRAVLSKLLSVYYKISSDKIEVVAVLDNRSDLAG